MKKHAKFAVIPAALAGFLALIALLYMAVISFALSPASYPQTPPYDAMALELTAYLGEDAPALSDTLFTERERLHMEDVLVLFQGGQRIALGCGLAAVVLALLALIWGGRKRVGNGLFMGIGAFAAVVLIIGLWALIDFNGWFTAMHELVFTNDLWLLDPAESMLIRMLPLDFFIGAVGTIALRFAMGALCLVLLAVACKQTKPIKGKQDVLPV